jgi:DNA-binding transcriptional MerR regulator
MTTTEALMVEHDEMVTSGEAARIARTCVETVRNWERAGLLTPVLRTSAGWRFYRRADVERIVAERAERRERR